MGLESNITISNPQKLETLDNCSLRGRPCYVESTPGLLKIYLQSSTRSPKDTTGYRSVTSSSQKSGHGSSQFYLSREKSLETHPIEWKEIEDS
jgi:hypothetical protein